MRVSAKTMVWAKARSRARMYRTSVHVRSDLGSTEPVEDGVAVQRGTHQSFLNGDELLKIGQAGRLPDSPHQSCKATARGSAAILTVEG